ncbi:MAG: hypothetical protein D4R96_02495 [Nitrosopumilaceae archaeon]|nr:MAG: hypothetical protein D4R96_02495 [Nitrosopumilaceae archaeon]
MLVQSTKWFCEKCPLNNNEDCGSWEEDSKIFKSCRDVHQNHIGWRVTTNNDEERLRGIKKTESIIVPSEDILVKVCDNYIQEETENRLSKPIDLTDEELVDFYGTKTPLDEKDAEFAIVYAIDAIISIENRVGNIEKPFT